MFPSTRASRVVFGALAKNYLRGRRCSPKKIHDPARPPHPGMDRRQQARLGMADPIILEKAIFALTLIDLLTHSELDFEDVFEVFIQHSTQLGSIAHGYQTTVLEQVL